MAQQAFKVRNGVYDTADAAGEWRWLPSAVSGNTATHLKDDASVAEQAAWDPYGRPAKGGSSEAGSKTKGSTFGFQSDMTDKVTGSLVLGARQFDPKTARFTTPDYFVAASLDLSLGTDSLTGNRYLFAAANPVAFYDDGHEPRLYDRYQTTIRRFARQYEISPILLATVIQHEGSGLAAWEPLSWFWERTSFPSSVGIGGMNPAVAAQLFGLTEKEARKRLRNDKVFAIKASAANLALLGAKGLTNEQAFISYAFSSSAIRYMTKYEFDSRQMFRQAYMGRWPWSCPNSRCRLFGFSQIRQMNQRRQRYRELRQEV